jgi:hypothetical protein
MAIGLICSNLVIEKSHHSSNPGQNPARHRHPVDPSYLSQHSSECETSEPLGKRLSRFGKTERLEKHGEESHHAQHNEKDTEKVDFLFLDITVGFTKYLQEDNYIKTKSNTVEPLYYRHPWD